MTRWNEGCSCTRCHEAQNDAARARFRRKAQERLPAEVRQQLLDAIYAGQPFREVLRDLGLTSNQVWGLTKTDLEWSEMLDTALTATLRMISSTGPMRRTSTDASAASAGHTSESVWPGTATEKLFGPGGRGWRCCCVSPGLGGKSEPFAVAESFHRA
jgi:hypothetical protein